MTVVEPELPDARVLVFTHHARQRMRERGAREEDVVEALRSGHREAAQRGLVQYRLTQDFNGSWGGRFYRARQVVVVVDEEPLRTVVVTLYTFYFQEGEAR